MAKILPHDWTKVELEALRGKYVSTRRPATADERAIYPEHASIGGAGTVVEVFEEAGMLWIAVDWGTAWVIDATTTIHVYDSEAEGDAALLQEAADYQP